MDPIHNLLDILYRRRSIRRYVANRPVDRVTITTLLEAAMAAPSACNLQPWEFIVIDEPEDVARLKECLGAHNGRHYNAPTAIVVCSNTSYIPWEGDGAMDCSAAIENLLLAATALGLGTVWIGDIDAGAIARLLDIPAHVALISVVLLGYPAEEKLPRTQYTEEAVYWGRYDPEREHPPRSIDLRFL
jgi:nitroreductase